jgi:hypothetical protein
MGFELTQSNAPVIGAAVSSAGSFFGQLAANAANRKMQQRTMDWNERMWHMNNQYNAPSAQMSRMQDAGIHPMLALEGMGGGNSGAPAASVTPSQMGNSMDGFDPVGDYMRLKQSSASIENMELLNDYQVSKNEYQEILNEQLRNTVAGEKEDYQYNRLLKRLEAKLATGQSLLQSQQYSENAIRISWANFNEEMNAIKGFAEIRQLNSRIRLNNQEWNYIKENGWRIPQKISSGLFTRYIMGTLEGSKQPTGKILKRVNDVVNKGVDSIKKSIKDYDPNNDWRYKYKWVPSEDSKIKKKNWLIENPSSFPPTRPGMNY